MGSVEPASDVFAGGGGPAGRGLQQDPGAALLAARGAATGAIHNRGIEGLQKDVCFEFEALRV